MNYSLILLTVFSVFSSFSHASHRRDLDDVKSRLQRKLAIKRGDLNDLTSLGQNANLPYLSTTLPVTIQYLDKIENQGDSQSIYVNKVNQTIKNLKTIKLKQRKEILEKFNENNLSLDSVVNSKRNFISSLTSGLKFIQESSHSLGIERDFYCGRKESFTEEEAFGLDLVPFNHPLRKTFVLKIQPFSKGGIKLLESMIEKFKIEDPSDLKPLMRLYAGLMGYAFSNLEALQNIKEFTSKSIPNEYLLGKSCRLLASLYDGETEECLKFSYLLLPFVRVIDSVLKIPEYEEFFTYPEIIKEKLEAHHGEFKRRSAFSRAAILTYQERQEEKTRQKQLLQQEVIEEKTLSSEGFKTASQMIFSPTAAIAEIKDKSSISTVSSPPFGTRQKEQEESLPSLEERKDRKRKAKAEKKLKHLQTLENSKDFTNDEKIEEQSIVIEKASPSSFRFVEIGGGPFKTFEKIMNKNFEGSMDKVIFLMEALNGTVDEGRSGFRIKFSLPYMNEENDTFLDMLPPEFEEEATETTIEKNGQPDPLSSDSYQTITIHAPHKQKSNKLRPYHVKDIRQFFLDAGYTLNNVKKR